MKRIRIPRAIRRHLEKSRTETQEYKAPALTSAAQTSLPPTLKEPAGPSVRQTPPAKRPNSRPAGLQTIPPELLIQIINEVGRPTEEEESKHIDATDRKSLLNFGLTCHRYLGLVLPELHYDAGLDFPLEQKHVTKTKDIRKTGWYTKRLTLLDNDDPWRVHRPGDILHLFPNITCLRLKVSSINAARELQMVHLALTIFSHLKDLSLEGQVKLVHLPQVDKSSLAMPSARLEKLRLVFRGVGSGSFSMGLLEMLQGSCRRLRSLEYKPFGYIEGNQARFDWEYIGRSVQSERLQEVKLHVPVGYFAGCMRLLRSLADRRGDLRVLDVNFGDSRLDIFSTGDAFTEEVLAFPNLTRIRITHLHPKGRDPITVTQRVLCAERLEWMFQVFTKELIRLRQIEWYEDGYLGEEWKWHREERKMWDKACLTRRLDAVP